jgi:hypothetical protein
MAALKTDSDKVDVGALFVADVEFNVILKEIYFKATPTMVYIIGHCRDHLPGSRGAGRLDY